MLQNITYLLKNKTANPFLKSTSNNVKFKSHSSGPIVQQYHFFFLLLRVKILFHLEIFWTTSFTCWGSCKLSIYESPHKKCISFTQTLESQMYLCAITIVYIIGMNYEP